MNILIDALPDSLVVDGKKYKIRTSFRDCLRVMLACESNELTPQEKQKVILENVYHHQPENVQEAMKQAMWFLDGGKDDTASTGGGVRLFSFEKDANFIFAAFKQTHQIDLTSIDLHWWQFMALFMDLGQDTAFCQLTSLRSRVKNGKATKEERQMANEMGDMFIVEDTNNQTIEEREREQEFLRLVEQYATRNT